MDSISQRTQSREVAASLRMGEPLTEAAHRPQHADHVVLDVDRVDRLKDKIQGEIQIVKVIQGGGPSIWRVSPLMRDQESKAYEPTFISIGPLHRSNVRLVPREDLKLKYLNDLLSRSQHNDLRKYIEVIYDCEPHAREQYGDEVTLDVDEFVRMLVVDGCFIIEYFIKYFFLERQGMVSESWDLFQVRRDLMLLENQIPFFVLKELFGQSIIHIPYGHDKPFTLMEVALYFLNVSRLPKVHHPSADQVLHLVHLHHLCLDPNLYTREEPFRYSFGQLVLYPLKKVIRSIWLVFISLLYLVFTSKLPLHHRYLESGARETIPCATKLRKVARIKFKKKVGVHSYLKVSFTEGTLEIPFLLVDELTSSQFHNIIALEDRCPEVGNYFTSYAFFMDNIIDTKDDVAIFQKHGIIESKVYTNEEVANMFNTLRNGTTVDPFDDYNYPLLSQVMKHFRDPYNRWDATIARWTDILISKYFSNPWAFISLLAAIFLLALTATQTYFAVYPRK